MGKECIDNNEPLFKVSAIVSGGDGNTKRQLVLIFSVSHILVDVDSFYRLYEMLDEDSNDITLNPKRFERYGSALRAIVGDAEVRFLTTSSLLKMGEYLSMYFHPRVSVQAYYVDIEQWIPSAKAEASDNSVRFVSSNDCLTSWFFNLCKCDFGIMKVNMRNRIDHVEEHMVGNYSNGVIYMPEDYATPALIRKSLPGLRRAGRIQNKTTKALKPTSLPTFLQCLKNKSGVSDNWSGAYRNVCIYGAYQLVHLPVILHYREMKYRDVMVIFKPTAGALGVLLLSRSPPGELEKGGPLRAPILKGGR